MRPDAATLLIGTLRKEFPDIPIHVHSHDTAGTAAATMLAYRIQPPNQPWEL
jgi:pyruvate carboxylase